MASNWGPDPRMLAFPITKPPPTRWEDVSRVHGRCSRHWGLIRGLIVEQKKARNNRSSSSARLTATLFREVVTRLSLSLEAVDTKDKFNSTPGVGEMIHKMGEKYLVAQVTARNPKHQPSAKMFVASPAAILVAMSREGKRRATASDVAGATDGDGTTATATATVWLREKEIRALAAPLCEEDLTHRGDEIVLGEVENFAWSSMAHLISNTKFDCVMRKDLDEKSAIAQLEEHRERPVCNSLACVAFATKSMGDLSEGVKTATFLRSVYCDEHFKEMGGGVGKRKGAAGKKKRKSSKVVLDEVDLSVSPGSDSKASGPAGSSHNPAPSPSTGGKIKAGWYRRLLGEALLKVELDRVERSKGLEVANALSAPWRKEFVKNAKTIYALTPSGHWMAAKLERAIAEGSRHGASANSTATASPILNRSSYASFSETDGGGGGGTAASPHNGHSPLAPTRAGGGAKPGVRLLIDNREKRGATKNSQISHMTSFLNSRGVPYEVREWKMGDYGWIVQPDAGKPPSAGEVGYEREFVVPRLLERKRVDDLAESIKDGRLGRQKNAMLRAKNEGVVSEVELHLEGDTEDSRYSDEIYRRGLTPQDLDKALHQSEAQGFKIVRHRNFCDFSVYLADATQALQKVFDAKSLDFESFVTWQNFIRFSKGQIPLTPKGAAAAAAAEKAAAIAKAARGGKRGRPPISAVGGGGRGRPPPSTAAASEVGAGLRQRTLDGVFGIAGRSRGAGEGSPSGRVYEAEKCDPYSRGGITQGVQEDGGGDSGGGSFSKPTVSWRENAIAVDADGVLPPDSGAGCDSSSDDCSIVEVVRRGASGGPGSGSATAAPTLRDGGAGAGGRGKRKAPAEAGTSPFTIAAAGGYSPAAARFKRAPPKILSLSKSAVAAGSPEQLLHKQHERRDSSPLPTTLGGRDRGGGETQSGWPDQNSSRRSKSPQPIDECGGPFSSRYCGGGGLGSGDSSRGGSRVSAAATKKARSLSFGDDDGDGEVEDDHGNNHTGGNDSGRSGGGAAHNGVSGVLRPHTSGSGSGGSRVSLPAGSGPTDDGGVVDLSLDSPSPPVPPRSRPRIAVSPPPQRQPNNSNGAGVSRETEEDRVVLEAGSSDDDFAM